MNSLQHYIARKYGYSITLNYRDEKASNSVFINLLKTKAREAEINICRVFYVSVV
jgi:hypothetical protein